MSGKKWIAIICVLALCAAALGAVCIGYQNKIRTLTQKLADASGENARITLTVEPESPEEAERLKEIVPQEPMELGERKKHHPYVLEYQGVSKVTAHLPSGEMELREAVDSGNVSLPRLVAQAEEDAAEGICEQWFSSEDKDIQLCWTTYRYPGFTMGVMTDMYEDTLLGERYLFKYVVIAPADTDISGPCTWRRDDETFAGIHRKEWGLTVTPMDVTSSGLSLECALSGEWFDGEIYLGDILSIARENNGEWETLKPLKETERLDYSQIKALGKSVPTGGEAEYEISWEDRYGKLESGAYNLRMQVRVGERNGGAVKVTFTVP